MFIPLLQNFWPRLASKYGVKKYWQSSGEESAIVNAVSECLPCRNRCSLQICVQICVQADKMHMQNTDVQADCTSVLFTVVPIAGANKCLQMLQVAGICFSLHPCRHVLFSLDCLCNPYLSGALYFCRSVLLTPAFESP